jgi:hypothetical protein
MFKCITENGSPIWESHSRISRSLYKANKEANKTKKFETSSGLMRMLDQKMLRLMRMALAVAVGFEPTVGFPPHTLSRRAP